jgi:hypothetical protein
MSNNNCIGPTNIIPNNNQVVLLDNNKSITVIDNNCCTNVDVTQPITSVVQVLTGPIGPTGKFPTSGSIGFTGSFDISGSLTVTGSITANTIYSPYFTGSFNGNGNGIFSGSFTGSFSANLQDITNNGNVTTLPITASSYYGNGLQIVGNAVVTGSLTVSGSNTFRNIGPTQFTGSTDITGSLSINGVDYEFTSASFNTRILNNSSSISSLSGSFLNFSSSYTTGSFTGSFTGSLLGTASYAENALTASYVENAQTASYVNLAQTASYILNAVSSSYSQTSSFAQTASYVLNAISSSFASTASYVQNAQTASYATQALSSSFTSTASYVQNAQTASYVLNAISSSYALTASYVANASSFPYTGSAIITGSLIVTGSIESTTGLTGSLLGTASYTNQALSSSFALTASYAANVPATASYALQALSSSYALTASYLDNYTPPFPYTGSAIITGSLIVTGSITSTQGFTGSLQGTASYANQALTASYANQALTASYATTSSYLTLLQQQIILSGSLKLDPTQDPDPTGLDLDSTVLFQSSSNTALGYDLYVRQNGNLVKWKWIEGILETGLLYGGVVTYSGSNVFVSPGSGIIAEHNATTGSEVSPMIEYVTWNAITQSVTNIATQQVTYLYIDNTGTLQQQSTRFTSQQYHDYIPLGAVGHFDYTQVSAFGGGVQTAYDQGSQTSNFIDAFGPLKVSGYGLTGQTNSLRLSVGSGISFIHGGFYQNDPEFPSQITTPSQATASLARVQRSGSTIEFDTNAGNLYTVVDPTKYDRDGDGTLANVGSGNWSIQRVFSDPKTGVLYVYYGQARYTSLLNALQFLPTDPFTEGDTFDFTTFVGFLVLKGNASDITDTAANSIINGGLFRGSGQGSGGGIALSNLDDLTDVSITSPVNGQALIYNSGIWQNGNPTSASYSQTALSSSYALTASYASTYAPVFPYTGSAIITGSLEVTGSILATTDITTPQITGVSGVNGITIITNNTASGSIAKGVNHTPTLVATTNNDIVVGLDIVPVYTNGVFTGVRNLDLRTSNFAVGKGIDAYTAYSSLWLGQSAPSNTNFVLRQFTTTAMINGPTGGTLQFAQGSISYGTLSNTSWTFSNPTVGSGAFTAFTFNPSANTNQTLSTNIPNFRINGANKQWATGNITNQYWNYLTANTASFVGASTITSSYGLFVEAATAGTNATITNNYAAGFGGRVVVEGSDSFLRIANGGLQVQGPFIATPTGAGFELEYNAGKSYVTSYNRAGSAWLPIVIRGLSIDLQLAGTSKLLLDSTNGLTVGDNLNLIIGTTFGSKIGTATTQKIGFWNATPVTQSVSSTAIDTLVERIGLRATGGGANFNTPITASIISASAFTGSLFGTATSASYVLQAVSSSFSSTSSYATNFVVEGTLVINETLTDSATINSSIVGSNNLFTQATGSYTSAFGKYTISNGSNARAGEFMTVWNGTTTTYTDTSTTDIGNTADITFTSAIVSSNIQIDAVAASSGWTIKMLTTFI